MGREFTIHGQVISGAYKGCNVYKWDDKLYLIPPVITIHIGSPINKDVKVYNGHPLEECGESDIFKYHLIPKGATPSSENEFTRTTIIEEQIELVPYHLIKISGEVNKDAYIPVDSNHNLGDSASELKEYLESKDYAVVEGIRYSAKS